MIIGDKLVSFRTNPFYCQDKFVKLGYAIYRSQKYFNGFVVEFENNPAYKEDVETEVSLEEIKEFFGEDWEEIEGELSENVKFTHFVSSPFSWDCLYLKNYFSLININKRTIGDIEYLTIRGVNSRSKYCLPH